MPRRTDISSILIIGSGPIVIGQGCEFDYSGVQACRALREEGYRIVLINSNPATIMTDPQFADATYIEPITPEAVEKILEREKQQGTPIDALLPTLGGQTGLNTGMACFDQGILTKYGVKMIGADRDAIHKGEDRQVFKDLMLKIGLNVPRSGVVHNMDDARKVLADIGLPLIIRPAFTLGGTGGGIAYNREEFEDIVQRGLDASPVTEVLIEQSVIGYKEYEMEVVRDKNDNCIVVCSIENIDAMGVHTGDSITVAPIQTLTDKEYQKMRDASFAIIRAVGVETGGSNIQFGINPKTGEMVVIEMNPRVSRSSALASKATGYPIAKIAAKLAIGYTLDELPNPITTRKRSFTPSADALQVGAHAPHNEAHAPRDVAHAPHSEAHAPRGEAHAPRGEAHAPRDEAHVREDYELYTSACFEPSIDYCVIKIPRWTFEKFPDADETLTTQMKSVGEAMAIGRTFKEALQKGIRSMEVKRFGFGLDALDQSTNGGEWPIPEDTLRRKLSVPSQGRLYYVRYALKMGWTIDQVYALTHYDPWFLAQMKELTDFEALLTPQIAFELENEKLTDKSRALLQTAKEWGYSDVQIADATDLNPNWLREKRNSLGLKPVYKLVDTCAAEFEAATPYYYSTYETPYLRIGEKGKSDPSLTGSEVVLAAAASIPNMLLVSEDEIRLTDKPKVIIIGGGPNRIGQGIEFDYCCVQAAFAMKELGYESVMINSNPETVSTDYDTSDLLFFEPLTHEDVLNICERLNGGPFASSLEVDSAAGVISDIERAALEREIQARKLGASLLLTVWRNQKDPTGPSGFLIYVANSWPRAVVLKPDGSLDSFIDDASGPAKDHLRSDDTLHQRVGQWRKKAPKNLVKGVIVQFGGQTPLNLARGLHEAGVPIIGTSIDMLEAAGDREKFRALVEEVGLKQPENGIARSVDDARKIAAEIGYPVLVRPSFVLGGRAMEIVSDEQQLNHYMAIAVKNEGSNPILVDKFLDHATEVDVDCIADYDPTDATGGQDRKAIVIGVMEHIEEAGIHSGDSACALPPYSLEKDVIVELKRQTKALAKALKVCGLMNVQYAIKDGEIYLIEVNPRASRTVPFVGKAHGVAWAKIAAKVMTGKTLAELGVDEPLPPKHVSVKEVVFPFSKFPGVDIILGPEMRSTGEVMGIDDTFAKAFAKSQIAAGSPLPTAGTVYVSVNNNDKAEIIPIAKQFEACGFKLIATGGTHDVLTKAGIKAERINKLAEGRPNIRDFIKNGQVQLIVNTPTKKGPNTDEGKIRSMAVTHRVTILTTLTAARAAALAIADLQKNGWSVKPLQAYHGKH